MKERRAKGARLRGLVGAGAVALFLVFAAPACRGKATPDPLDATPSGSLAAPSTSQAPVVEPDPPIEADAGASRGKISNGTPAEGPEDPKKSFLDNRIAKGKSGVAEIVSLRVWHCGPSCTCPEPCIETVTEETGLRWIDLHDEGGADVSLADWANADVTGRFTGRTRLAKSPSGGEPYVVPELRLTSSPTIVSTSMGPEIEGAHAKVVLAGPAAQKLVTRVKDDKPWLVIAGAFPLADATRADTDASALFEKLDKLGIKDAERYDSRAFVGLACCFDVVLGGRFADPKAAEARARTLSARGVKAYTKKGF